MPHPSLSRDPADAALTELHREHYGSLVRLAAILLLDIPTAEDVVQDCFARLHVRRRQIEDPKRAVGYLRRSVVNAARSQLRWRRVRRRGIAAPDSQGSIAVPNRDHVTVVNALQGLPTRERECIALWYYLDLSEREIASVLGIAPGSVKSHLNRGLTKLRPLLEGL